MKPLRIAAGLALDPDFVTKPAAILAQRSEAEIAWVAGLFEGEGCIYIGPTNNNGTTRRLSLVSTDHDVLVRLRELAGVGTVTSTQVKGNRKPAWVWGLTRWRDIEAFLVAILPYLCERRTEKALAMLATRPNKCLGVCPTCGNPLEGENADVYHRKDGRVGCAPCARRRTARWHERRRASA